MKALLIDAVEVKEIDIENNLEALQKAVDGALIVGVNGEEFTDVPEATVDSILYDYK